MMDAVQLCGAGDAQDRAALTISDFRKDDLEALTGLFLQVLLLCQPAGLVKLRHVALDDTKVRATEQANRSGNGEDNNG